MAEHGKAHTARRRLTQHGQRRPESHPTTAQPSRQRFPMLSWGEPSDQSVHRDQEGVLSTSLRRGQ
eukprot:2317739-Prymnesium_polylepis.2